MLRERYQFDECIKDFEDNYAEMDLLLERLFRDNKYNNYYSEVLSKVLAINSFYTTHIDKKDIYPLVSHIVSIDNLDTLLDAGKIDAYYKIAKTPKDINDAFVFASKYCHFHNPRKYPIFDSYSRRSLYYINKIEKFTVTFNQNALLKYEFYKDCIDKLIKECEEDLHMYYDKESGTDYRYKKVDEFLWQYCKNNENDIKEYINNH